MEKTNSCTAEASSFLPFRLDTLPQEIIKKAEMELNETPERRQEAIKELRRLIHAEADFRPLMEDKFLIRFLRVKKFDSRRAFNMLKNFYTFKVRYSRILTDFKPSELRNVFDQNVLGVMPYRDSEGCVVGVGMYGPFDFDKATIDEVFASVLIAAEECISCEATQICGGITVADCKGLSFKTLMQLASPRLLYRVIKVVQDCFPARFKALHVINEPFYSSIVFNIVKPFLSEKNRKRIHFYGSNLKKLHEVVPPCLLPEEFGGELGRFDSSDFVATILSKEAMYERNSKYGYQEKKANFIRKKSSLSFGLYH